MIVDVGEDGSVVGGHLRVKARIDIRRPLMRGILLEEVGGEGGGWCPFKYEFPSNFCYLYGKLGHVERECDEKMEEGGARQYMVNGFGLQYLRGACKVSLTASGPEGSAQGG